MKAVVGRSRTAYAALALSGVIVACCAASADAHEGPPFPILMDQMAAGYSVSVWADPDIGEAQFFIIVESPEGGIPSEVPQVTMWTEPVSGRLERETYETSQSALRSQLQFEAAPYFDQRDMWTVGFRLSHPGGQPQEITTEVESTPPGYGLWDLAIYLFPFLLLGGLWVIAMMRRRRWQDQMGAEPNVVEGTSEQPSAIRRSAKPVVDEQA